MSLSYMIVLQLATKALVYCSIAQLRKYILRAVLIVLLPGRKTMLSESVFILILFRTVILWHGLIIVGKQL